MYMLTEIALLCTIPYTVLHIYGGKFSSFYIAMCWTVSIIVFIVESDANKSNAEEEEES